MRIFRQAMFDYQKVPFGIPVTRDSPKKKNSDFTEEWLRRDSEVPARASIVQGQSLQVELISSWIMIFGLKRLSSPIWRSKKKPQLMAKLTYN
jgi:hypothetical protein